MVTLTKTFYSKKLLLTIPLLRSELPMSKNVIKKALTFDDVLLVPQKSSVLPKRS